MVFSYNFLSILPCLQIILSNRKDIYFQYYFSSYLNLSKCLFVLILFMLHNITTSLVSLLYWDLPAFTFNLLLSAILLDLTTQTFIVLNNFPVFTVMFTDHSVSSTIHTLLPHSIHSPHSPWPTNCISATLSMHKEMCKLRHLSYWQNDSVIFLAYFQVYLMTTCN